ncbi:hypothetical protein [Microbacterium sp. NPDC080220]|uniref:hypothetical protein n=1 Tax=Microbacterium sp. NPDC080220 TaxID=3161017 RepID=UPI0034497C27
MSTSIVPDSTKLAAKRGFIRTTAQAYSTSLAGGISTTVIIGLTTGEVQPIPLAITVGVALVTPLLAGAASALSILSRGIPGEYVEAGLDEAAESDGFTTPEG